MTAPEPEVTLTPLSTLLTRIAELLEQEVVPYLAGRPLVAAAEAVDQLRRIVAERQVLEDPIPDYCESAACLNLASVVIDSSPPVHLCLGCREEYLRRVLVSLTYPFAVLR